VPEAKIERLPLPLRDMLKEVVERIVNDYGPVEKILLFGSAARGEQDEASDLDLIIIKRTSERFLRRLLSVPALPVAADVFVYTPEEFATMRAEENPFILNALRDAIVLYEVETTR
jgi:predicted nucleotidyltransferase